MIDWRCCTLDQLDALSVYQMYRLRQQVFVLEQSCLYEDIDTLDLQALHLLGNTDSSLVAYLRILAPGVSYKEPAIGRVVIDESSRGQGLGRLLIEQGIRLTREQFGGLAIRISAQSHLTKLYEEAGFKPVGDAYVEDGIPHQEMLLVGTDTTI